MVWEFIKTDTMPKDGAHNLPTRVIPFVWYFARQVKWQLGVITFFFALSSLMFPLLTFGVKLVVDAYTENPSLTNNPSLQWGIIIFGLIYAVRILSEIIGDFLAVFSQANYSNFIRLQVSSYVSKHSYRYFQDDFAGRIANKVLDTPSRIREFTFTIMEQAVFIIILTAGIIGVFSTVSLEYAAAVFIWAMIYGVILTLNIPSILTRTKIAVRQLNILRGRYIDVIVNILLVKLFARRFYEDNNLKEQARENVYKWNTRDLTSWRLDTSIYISLLGLFLFIVFILLSDIREQQISAGDIGMILSGFIFLSNNSVWISRMFAELFMKYGEIYEGIDLITAAHEVLDQPNAPALVVTRGDIALQNVTFTYPGRPVFTNLSLTIPPGQKVGLVGPSGAGKSTLVQIMLRLYDLQGGAILIDGQNIAGVQQDSLRAQIAVIPQNADLLHRSIRDNILYGRLDASQADIESAARAANADEFIAGLVDKDGNTGYDAQVGERGVKLSGGQRQRIAIARAILKNAPILLLDEATSALDSVSEALIQKSLFDVMQGRTVMAIAHRLSTIQHMDRLLVMRDGQIIEDGSHADLLSRGGYYASLWARQAGGFLSL